MVSDSGAYRTPILILLSEPHHLSVAVTNYQRKIYSKKERFDLGLWFQSLAPSLLSVQFLREVECHGERAW